MLYNRESDWNPRAPSYAYESDSSDDEWTDTIKNQENLPARNPPEKLTKPKKPTSEEVTLEWKPDIPKPIEAGKPMMILIGSSTKLITQKLKLEKPSSLITLNYNQNPLIYFDPKNSIIYIPNKDLIQLNLQTRIAKEIIMNLNPTGNLIILSTYEISNYITKNFEEISRIRYVCCDKEEETVLENQNIQKFSVPNLVQGIDAAIFLQAEMTPQNRRSKPILFLLPNQSETSTELYETNLSHTSSDQQKETRTVSEYISKKMGLGCKAKEELGLDDGFDWNLFDHLKPNVVLNEDYMKSMYV